MFTWFPPVKCENQCLTIFAMSVNESLYAHQISRESSYNKTLKTGIKEKYCYFFALLRCRLLRCITFLFLFNILCFSSIEKILNNSEQF